MKHLFLLLCLMAASTIMYAQTIPQGSCGIMFTYDASGNRVKREYYCNVAPAPLMAALAMPAEKEAAMVNSLYPNPTTGKVTVAFSKTLKDVQMYLVNSEGKVLFRLKGSNTIWNLDLSSFSDGIYYLHIDDKKQQVTKKIIKIGE